MQKFKDFINEEHQIVPLFIEVDSRLLENNKDSMNADFDRLTAMPFQNSIVFYNQLRGTLERYGMVVPPAATRHFLNFDGLNYNVEDKLEDLMKAFTEMVKEEIGKLQLTVKEVSIGIS